VVGDVEKPFGRNAARETGRNEVRRTGNVPVRQTPSADQGIHRVFLVGQVSSLWSELSACHTYGRLETCPTRRNLTPSAVRTDRTAGPPRRSRPSRTCPRER